MFLGRPVDRLVPCLVHQEGCPPRRARCAAAAGTVSLPGPGGHPPTHRSSIRAGRCPPAGPSLPSPSTLIGPNGPSFTSASMCSSVRARACRKPRSRTAAERSRALGRLNGVGRSAPTSDADNRCPDLLPAVRRANPAGRPYHQGQGNRRPSIRVQLAFQHRSRAELAVLACIRCPGRWLYPFFRAIHIVESSMIATGDEGGLQRLIHSRGAVCALGASPLSQSVTDARKAAPRQGSGRNRQACLPVEEHFGGAGGESWRVPSMDSGCRAYFVGSLFAVGSKLPNVVCPRMSAHAEAVVEGSPSGDTLPLTGWIHYYGERGREPLADPGAALLSRS